MPDDPQNPELPLTPPGNVGPGAANIQPVNIEEEMRRSYLDYSMSVIIGRDGSVGILETETGSSQRRLPSQPSQTATAAVKTPKQRIHEPVLSTCRPICPEILYNTIAPVCANRPAHPHSPCPPIERTILAQTP